MNNTYRRRFTIEGTSWLKNRVVPQKQAMVRGSLYKTLSDFYFYNFAFDLVIDSKDEPEYNDGQSPYMADLSSKSNHVA